MTETSRIWCGTSPGDAGPYDGPTDWAEIWATFLGPWLDRDGVFYAQPTNVPPLTWRELEVTWFGGFYWVFPGRALVDGTWYENDTLITTIAAALPAVNPRIDRIVLRKDFAAQTVRVVVITGVENAAPVAPAITQIAGVTWDLPLWQIYFTIAAFHLYIDEREFIGPRNYWGREAGNVASGRWGDFYEDFIGQLGQWLETTLNASGAFICDAGLGEYRFTSDTSATGHKILSTPVTIDARRRQVRHLIRAKTPATDANLRPRIGLFNAVPSTGTPDPTEGIYFRHNGAGNWFAVTRTGGVETATDTGLAPIDTYRNFETRTVFSVAGNAASFWVDGVLIATHITNVPTVCLLQALGLTYAVAPAAVNGLDIDYVRLFGRRTDQA